MKGFVDISDQMAAYSPFIRRTAKWYMRLFFHLVTQTALVNAWILYCQTNRIQLNDFKISTAEILMGLNSRSPHRQGRKRELIEKLDLKGNDRRHCKSCYSRLSNEYGRVYAKNNAKNVKTQCSVCEDYICLECFQRCHKSCVCA